jgi:hypothetical protein
MEGLNNPFPYSKTKVEKLITENYYKKKKEKYDLHFEIEEDNETSTLLKHKETGMGVHVKKRFDGYFPKPVKAK